MRVTLLSVKVSSRLNNLRPHCPQNVVSSVVSDRQKGQVLIGCHTPFLAIVDKKDCVFML